MSFQVDLKPYRLAFRQPLRTAHGLWSDREGVLVRLLDAEGRAGYGEVAPVPGFAGASVAEAEAELRDLGRIVSIESLTPRIHAGGAVAFALASAVAGLRAAGGDAGAGAGAKGRPDYLTVAALLPAGRGALTVARERAEVGFRTFKWKVGVADPADERGLLDDVLAVLPTGSRLRLDANGAWDRRVAEAWLARCADREGIDYVEQPVAAGTVASTDLLLGLAGDFPVSLALDESLVGPDDLRHWLDCGWRGVWVLKPALLGDPAFWQAQVRAHRLDVVVSTALETAVGLRAVLTAGFEPGLTSRALGTGVGPLFLERAANGPAALPWVRWSDVENLDPEAVWNALN